MYGSTLLRKGDIDYKNNKIILIISAIVFIAGYFITKEFVSALYLGLGTLLTWAIAREMDPKRKYSAFLCTALSLVNLFYYENIQLLVLLWILLLMRLVNEISGKAASPLDVFLLMGISIYLSIDNKHSMYLAPFIMAIVYRVKTKGKSKVALAALIIPASIFMVQNSYFRFLTAQDIDFSNRINTVIIISIFAFIMWLGLIDNKGITDDASNPVHEKSIRYAQLLFSNTILFLFLFTGISLNNLIIYYSIIIGFFVYFFIDKVQSKLNAAKV